MAFYQELHTCLLPPNLVSKLGDGYCNFGTLNAIDCGWDAGDCKKIGQFPDCHVDFPRHVGNGECHDDNDNFVNLGDGYNTEECGWD